MDRMPSISAKCAPSVQFEETRVARYPVACAYFDIEAVAGRLSFTTSTNIGHSGTLSAHCASVFRVVPGNRLLLVTISKRSITRIEELCVCADRWRCEHRAAPVTVPERYAAADGLLDGATRRQLSALN